MSLEPNTFNENPPTSQQQGNWKARALGDQATIVRYDD
jgi:hypothetical protein